MSVAYFGHVNLDRVLSVGFIPDEGSVPVVSVRETVGGTAGNFAIAASRIGLRATVYSSCSSSVLGRLKEKVGDCVELRVDASDGEWPVCTIASDGKKQVAYIYQGGMANWAPRYSEGGEAYLHFTTGPPAEYLKIARNWSGKAIIFDPSQEISYGYDRDTVREFLGLSTFVLVNRAELAHMVRISGMSEDEISREVTSVIVTEGDRGATILSDGRREHIGAFPVERPFDTVGAGDAFRAGFHLGLQRGASLQSSVLLGNYVASKWVSHRQGEFQVTSSDMDRIASILDGGAR
ncbi:carbohydrate kinase family protein [Thermogymnomonas acidicola]|uniref:Carbohydrate kinase family protein n=1 Tax=Thermogymnomonas acidicola TaxID=399579 RepID=A0AA37BR93_9ARCH|nr:carbohydrate kinase family protein [Thermogymnomonas acidicola]GGM73870.1 carbohydrate kinase family protein [Thermogymnomonas acidicola]